MTGQGRSPHLSRVTAPEWLTLGALLLCSAFALSVTPLYEAPDEPAHLHYVAHVLRTSTLPPVPDPGQYDLLNYEAHQPPLAYLTAAAVVRLSGHEELPVRATLDSRFSFSEKGSRMFLPVDDPPARRAAYAARASGVFWLLLSLLAILMALQKWSSSSVRRAAALACIAGCPQYIWLSGVMNNDGALVALSGWTILGLLVVLEERSVRWLAIALISASLAVLAKGSALFLVGGFVVAALVLLSRRSAEKGYAAAVAAAGAAPVVVFAMVNYLRTGSIFPPLPATHGGGWTALIANPSWPAKVAYSFWAKFGWMNTPMDPLWYVWFAVVMVAVLYGSLRLLLRSRGESVLLVSLVVGNLAVLVVYLASVDFQTQGRYLHPVLIVLAIWFSATLEHFRRRWISLAALAVGLAAPIAGILEVWLSFR